MESNNNQKAIIFDFDCTFSQIHCYYLLNNFEIFIKNDLWMKKVKELEIENDLIEIIKAFNKNMLTESQKISIIKLVFGDELRMTFIKNLLNKAVETGYCIIIASNGIYNYIDKLLILANLRDYFDIIKCKSTINYNEKYVTKIFKKNMLISKDEFIRKLFNEFNKIVYIDDDQKEYNDFCINYNCTKEPIGKKIYKSDINPLIYESGSRKELIFYGNLGFNENGISEYTFETFDFTINDRHYGNVLYNVIRSNAEIFLKYFYKNYYNKIVCLVRTSKNAINKENPNGYVISCFNGKKFKHYQMNYDHVQKFIKDLQYINVTKLILESSLLN
jgi:hypothetical protein